MDILNLNLEVYVVTAVLFDFILTQHIFPLSFLLFLTTVIGILFSSSALLKTTHLSSPTLPLPSSSFIFLSNTSSARDALKRD